ncbi:MAG: hypothetical protein ACOH2H_24735 [Cypionkella sp.]
MLKRLIAKLTLWAKVLERIDDPLGAHFLGLESRIRALEDAKCDLSDPPRRP